MSLKHFVSRHFAVLSIAVCASSIAAQGQSTHFQPNPAAGPTGVSVKGKFSGQIFGFDIDQNGTEGLLSEAKSQASGNIVAAIETFDQTTGKIVKVVQQTQGQDDFLTVGVLGTSVGLVEREHEISFLNIQR